MQKSSLASLAFLPTHRRRAARGTAKQTGSIFLRLQIEDPPMIDASTAPYAALLLRIGLGLLFLAHANLQIRVYGLPTEAKYFRSIGLPVRLVYLTASMHVIWWIALLTIVYARFAALLLLPII